ncbi:MAG: DNA-binding protein, partial [Candidatus Competibacteraceae bacterium]
IAIAAVHGADYLLTWNCKHIANARQRPIIEAICEASGYRPPVICTPEELLGDHYVD